MTINKIIAGVLFLLLAGSDMSGQDVYDAMRDSLMGIVNEAPSVEAKLDSVFQYAVHYDFAPFTKELLDHGEAILDQADGMDHLDIEMELQQGQYYAFSSAYDTAIVRYERGLAYPSIDDYVYLKAEILSAMGTAYNRLGSPIQGVNSFLATLELLDDPVEKAKYVEDRGQEDYDKLQAVVNNNVGNLYLELKEYDQAIPHYDKAIELIIALGAERFVGTPMMNKAKALEEQGTYKAALKAHRQAKEIKVKYKSTDRAVAMSDLHIGSCLMALDSLVQAGNYFDRSLQVFEQIENYKGTVLALSQKGLLSIKKNKCHEARVLCTKSLTLQESLSDKESIKDTYQCLYEANKSLGDYNNAMIYLEKLKGIQDSIYSLENLRKVGLATVQSEYKRAKLIRESEISAELRRQRIIRYGMTGGILALLTLTGLIYSNYANKKKYASELADKNAIISKALGEKDLLLKEIHHRVKNNLQFVSSLLNLQSRHVDDDKVQSVLREGQNRVKSMALIHQKLYQEENLTGVQVKEYFEKLIENLFSSYNVSPDRIKLSTDIDAINIDVDTLIPIGLIANELISNSLKHAFDRDENGEISVVLNKRDDLLYLIVSDDGRGLGVDVSELPKKSFGYKMIYSFARQLRADVQISEDPGTKVHITIKNFKEV